MMIGPRQIAGASRSTMSASDMSFTPWASSGWILPPRTSGRLPALGDVHAHRRDAVYTLHGFPHLASEGTGIVTAEQERERHRAIPRDGKVFHHAGCEDVRPAAGILEFGQGALDARLECIGSGHGRKVDGDARAGQRCAGRRRPQAQGPSRRPVRSSAMFVAKTFCLLSVCTARMSSSSWWNRLRTLSRVAESRGLPGVKAGI